MKNVKLAENSKIPIEMGRNGGVERVEQVERAQTARVERQGQVALAHRQGAGGWRGRDAGEQMGKQKLGLKRDFEKAI